MPSPTSIQPALPPQRSGGRHRFLAERVDPGAHATEGRRPSGRTPGLLHQPGYRPTRGHRHGRCPFACGCGEAARMQTSGCLRHVPRFHGLQRAEAGAPSLSPRLAAVMRAGTKHARPDRRHRYPRAAAARTQHRRHRPHRRRDDPRQQRRFRRGLAAPRGGPAGRAQRRPGPELGLLPARRRNERHRDLDRRRSHRHRDRRPGRVRIAQPSADRPHRGPARARVEPVRRRCGRRRDPDLHAARRSRRARARQRGCRQL